MRNTETIIYMTQEVFEFVIPVFRQSKTEYKWIYVHACYIFAYEYRITLFKIEMLFEVAFYPVTVGEEAHSEQNPGHVKLVTEHNMSRAASTQTPIRCFTA